MNEKSKGQLGHSADPPNAEFPSEIAYGKKTTTYPSILREPETTIDPYRPRAGPPQGPLSKRKRTFDLSLSPVVKPLIAPAVTAQKLSLTFAEKERVFRSRQIKDIWTLYFDLRAQFPRPDDSDAAVKSSCLDWKRKYKGGSPRSLHRFFKSRPDLAAWAVWTEQAINETQARSGKNRFPRLELLRECVGIMMQHRLEKASV